MIHEKSHTHRDDQSVIRVCIVSTIKFWGKRNAKKSVYMISMRVLVPRQREREKNKIFQIELPTWWCIRVLMIYIFVCMRVLDGSNKIAYQGAFPATRYALVHFRASVINMRAVRFDLFENTPTCSHQRRLLQNQIVISVRRGGERGSDTCRWSVMWNRRCNLRCSWS